MDWSQYRGADKTYVESLPWLPPFPHGPFFQGTGEDPPKDKDFDYETVEGAKLTDEAAIVCAIKLFGKEDLSSGMTSMRSSNSRVAGLRGAGSASTKMATTLSSSSQCAAVAPILHRPRRGGLADTDFHTIIHFFLCFPCKTVDFEPYNM
jgi:hypothetical protein